MKSLKDILAFMVAAFPNQAFPQETVAVYAEMLKDIKLEVLYQAVRKLLREGDRSFIPTIGQIRHAVTEIREEIDGTPSALDAWNYVQAHISDGGPGPGVERCWLAERAVENLGGWYQLGMGKVANQEWVRKEFLATYAALLDRKRKGEDLPEEDRQFLTETRTGRMEHIAEGSGVVAGLIGRHRPERKEAGGE